MEHQQRCGFRERLVLAPKLSFQFLDASALATTCGRPRTAPLESFKHRGPPLLQLRLMHAFATEERAELRRPSAAAAITMRSFSDAERMLPDACTTRSGRSLVIGTTVRASRSQRES